MRVVECRFGVVNGTGADDDQQARIAPVEHGSNSGACIEHGFLQLGPKREFGFEYLWGGKLLDALDAQVFSFLRFGIHAAEYSRRIK